MGPRLHIHPIGNGLKSASQLSWINHLFLKPILQITIGLFFISIFISSSVAGLDPNANKYTLIKKWGSEGSGNGQFQRIHDLDFDPSESLLYVVDRDGNRIQVFDKNGTFITK